MDSMTREQLVVKIANDIVCYNEYSPQVKLSLLQDLIIETLPHIEHGSPEYMKLMSVRCHKPAEDIIAWVDALMHVYLTIPKVSNTLSQLPAAILIKPY
jgi:hypothetical protein